MRFKNLWIATLVIGLWAACTQNNIENKNTKKRPDTSSNFKPQVLKDTIGGIYHEYYNNGKIKMQGMLKEGKREGDWSYFYENGKVWSLGEYVNGKRNGIGNVFYENGVLRMEGIYKDDQQVGKWKFYSEQGKLIKEVEM
jgi:antitoxin component YwqK of YwqJK toxin-antitoxin module